MTTITIERQPRAGRTPGDVPRRVKIAKGLWKGITAGAVSAKAKAHSGRVLLLTCGGFGLFDAAGFTHSLFAGLVVTATSAIVTAWLVEGEDKK
jgi:hypothetical protein